MPASCPSRALSALPALLWVGLLLAPAPGCASDESPRGMRLPPDRSVEAEPERAAAERELAAAGIAPRPYTWQQIRDAMPEGFLARYRVEYAGQDPVITVSRVTRWGERQGTLWQQKESLDGQPLGPPEEAEERWEDLRDHATFPAAETTIAEEELVTPAGRFDCWLYTVVTRAEGRTVESRFHFAKLKPGAPVRYERLEDGRRSMLMALQSYALPGVPHDARQLLARVQAAGRFPTTIRFVQDVTTHAPDGTTSESSMAEWAAVPGRLRIDVSEPEPATLLFSDERIVRVAASGRSERPGPSMPMLLMIDVLAQEPAAWLARAAAHGVDTSLLSEQSWDGRPCVVLGARPGDELPTQVWFDARTWLPVRYLETTGGGDTARHTDGRALDYREIDGRLFHTRFEFRIDGHLVLEERYRDLALDAELDAGTFDPEQAARRFGSP